MEKPRIRIYTDYKSPYAFVANKRLFELEDKYDVELGGPLYVARSRVHGHGRRAHAAFLAQGALCLHGRGAMPMRRASP
jgi:hypothetical protein